MHGSAAAASALDTSDVATLIREKTGGCGDIRQTEVVGRWRPSLPDPAVPPDVVGRGMGCRAPVALPVTDDDRQMGGVSNSMAVPGRTGSPTAGRLLLTACGHSAGIFVCS